jgi:hypothetical protein
VPQNSNIWVSGWAADKKAKGPATKVVVLIDGTPLSNANLGTSRPDVAAALGSSSYTNTGWYLNTSIGSLATGTHSVTAVAYDSTNATTTVGAATITVTVANTPPFGTMDGAVSASGGTSSVAQSSNLWVSGWAADQQDKAPVTKVVVLIDGTPFGNATMGAARPDVASALGSSAYANSGWYLNQSIGSLAAGTHTVTAVAYDSANATTTLGSAQITVTVSNTPPFGSMDAAVNAGNGTSTMAQNSTMWVSGWAADQQDKAPVTKVQIFIDGVAVANATMGTSRPDVASALGSSSYTNSGWWLTYNIGTLSVGTHTVSAVATDSAGASTTLGSAQITVTQ